MEGTTIDGMIKKDIDHLVPLEIMITNNIQRLYYVGTTYVKLKK